MAEPPSPGWTAPPDAEVQGETPLIYVVRDEDTGRQDAAALSCAYAVLCTTDLQDACELLRSHHQHVAAVLIDLGFSGGDLDGVALATLLRGKPAAPPPPYAAELVGLDLPVALIRSPHESLPALDVKTLDRPIDLGAMTLFLADAHLSSLQAPGAR